MKKRLEADLISIAHRILKLKNKSELIELHQETQKLYEKLSVLRFVEEHFGDVKPTIGLAEIKEKLETTFTTQSEAKKEEVQTETVAQETIVAEPQAAVHEDEEVATVPEKEAIPEITAESDEDHTVQEENIEEPVPNPEEPPVKEEEPVVKEEVTAQEPVFVPAFELSFEPKTEAPQEVKPEPQQISFEELLGHTYKEPIFEKVGENAKPKKEVPETEMVAKPEPATEKKVKSTSLNDTLSKTISIGLNDRIGFEKHLFGGSSEDLNRVLSQLNTFDNLQEAINFITTFVKPDYNDWNGKEEYESRFMELVEKKFA